MSKTKSSKNIFKKKKTNNLVPKTPEKSSTKIKSKTTKVSPQEQNVQENSISNRQSDFGKNSNFSETNINSYVNLNEPNNLVQVTNLSQENLQKNCQEILHYVFLKDKFIDNMKQYSCYEIILKNKKMTAKKSIWFENDVQKVVFFSKNEVLLISENISIFDIKTKQCTSLYISDDCKEL